MNKNPALVARHRDRYLAWNEDARLIAVRWSWDGMMMALRQNGYNVISPNSRLAATIRDKWRTRGYHV